MFRFEPGTEVRLRKELFTTSWKPVYEVGCLFWDASSNLESAAIINAAGEVCYTASDNLEV